MAAPNTNVPFGLMPLASLTGVSESPMNRYYIPSTDNSAYYIGSPVKLTNTADTNGVPGVIVCAGTDIILGPVVGVEIAGVNPNAVSMVGSSLALEQVSIPATKTKAYYVYVADDPLMMFALQADATTTNQTAANANNNCSLTITAPSPSTLPNSATVASSSTFATTNTLNIKLMGLIQTPGAAFGAYSVYKCKINKHQYADQIAGV